MNYSEQSLQKEKECEKCQNAPAYYPVKDEILQTENDWIGVTKTPEKKKSKSKKKRGRKRREKEVTAEP
jgi:hypothetical protein